VEECIAMIAFAVPPVHLAVPGEGGRERGREGGREGGRKEVSGLDITLFGCGCNDCVRGPTCSSRST